MRMLHINTVHVQRETLWVKQLAGEQYKMICSGAWACKHQARAEGGAVGAWAPAPFPLDAQSALLSRQFKKKNFFIIIIFL